MDNFKWWLSELVNGMDESITEEAKKKVFQKCGKACFSSCNITETIKECMKNTDNIESLLNELNKIGIGGGKLKLEGNTISGTYEKCYCPLRNEMGEGISPSFCNCTRGWAKSMFEIILDKEVEVELIQAIGRGDKVCKFVTYL